MEETGNLGKIIGSITSLMRVEIMMAELSAAYACDLAPSPFSNVLFRDLSKISPVYHPAILSTDALLRPFEPFVRFDVKSTAAPRRRRFPRVTHPEILGFNCAPDISG